MSDHTSKNTLASSAPAVAPGSEQVDTQAAPRPAEAAAAAKADAGDDPTQEAIETGSSWYSDLMEKRSGLTKENFELALKVFGAITVVLAGLQYLNSVRREEVSKTLELIAVWEQGELQKSYSKIADRIAELNERNSSFLSSASTSQQMRAYQSRVGNQLIQPGDANASLKPETEAIFGFLDRVGFCVKHDICSKAVALEYFGESATSMFEYFGGFVEARRKTVPSFARASEHISAAKP